jgi:cysteine-rich repeat protein
MVRYDPSNKWAFIRRSCIAPRASASAFDEVSECGSLDEDKELCGTLCGDEEVDVPEEQCDIPESTCGSTLACSGCRCAACTQASCDDGNPCTDDSCNAQAGCQHVFRSACLASVSFLTDVDASACGDGVVDAGERCDDGNGASGDGCDSECEIESCFDCSGSPSGCQPLPSCGPRDGCCPDGCAGVDADCETTTAVAGARVTITDAVDDRRRGIMVVAADSNIEPARLGFDPVRDGARLQVQNSYREVCITLPNLNDAWRSVGEGPRRSYKYRDSRYVNGPCKSAALKQGRLTVTCNGKVWPFDFALDDVAQGAVAVRFASGHHTLCAQFGGSVVSDKGIDTGSGIFSARAAPAPASCATLLYCAP